MRFVRFDTRVALGLLPLAAVLSVGCQPNDVNVNRLTPDIAVAPENVDYGDVVVLYSETELIQIINAGRAPLEITDISVDGGSDSFEINPSSITLEADESVPIEVVFSPQKYIEYTPNLVITSNDEDSPTVSIPLTGEGVEGPTPDIAIDQGSLDFGTITVGETGNSWFTISNEGDGPLNIEDVVLEGSGSFTLMNDPEGQTLATEGDEATVIVVYEPTGESGDNGSITITSNDPDEPELEVLLVGNGGGDFDYPVAVIDCPGSTVDPPYVLDLDGTDSYDPNGYEPLTYEWSISKAPSGNSAEIDDDASDYTSVDVNVAGEWEIQLKVTNSAGLVSAPAECEFDALPEDALHVELTWDSGNADLDLHLLQSGYSFNELPGDCCWCNKNPAWGESGTADDPLLALDNRVGYGPENIKLYAPVDGDYPIKAHYYEDNGGGTTTATVTIWIDGVKKDSTSIALTHNDKWDVGYIRWPEGVFVENDTSEPSSASTKNCWSPED